MLAINLATLLDQLRLTNLGSLLSIYCLVLAVQMSLRSDHVQAPNYIDRSYPTYNSCPSNPSSGGLLGSLLDAIFSFGCQVPDNACQRSQLKDSLEFDFIIVGAGASGPVVARRLTEDPNIRVLLVEAGMKMPMQSVIPFFFPFVFNFTSALWPYFAEPTPNASLAYNIGTPMQVGKGISGSTGVNAMLWVCCHDRDYNDFSKLGMTDWDYKSLLPFFRKVEDNRGANATGDYHGKGGPLTISDNEILNPIIYTVIDGYKELGYKLIHDYSPDNYNGIVMLQSTKNELNERESSYQGYLEPVKNRPNLFIASEALVTHVTFEGTIATGVNVQTNKKECPNIVFKAKKEVILSAGAIGTPKILLQSGVGPEAHLKDVNIPLVKDLPVGKNLQDHATGVGWLKFNCGKAKAQTLPEVLLDGVKYLLFRKGSYSVLGTSSATGFVDVNDTKANYSEVEIIHFVFERTQQFGEDIFVNLGLKDEHIETLVETNQECQLMMLFITVLRPKSTGTVELRGKDPNSTPKITSGYFTDPEDYDRTLLVKGLEKVDALIQTEAWDGLDAEFVDFGFEDCKDLKFKSTEYWRCFTRYSIGSEWHFTSSAKAGAEDDDGAVVDPSLLVRGLQQLRVCDASIMPFVPSGNIQCPCYMVGEKCADLVKKKHNIL